VELGWWEGADLYPFERFTNTAKKTLTVAQREAEGAHHSYIGTEHILIALLTLEEAIGGEVLRILGITLDETRRAVADLMAKAGGGERMKTNEIVPTSRVKRVIEHAFENARADEREKVDSGDLLVGLLLEPEGIAGQVLIERDVTLPGVRSELFKITPSRERETTGPEPQRFPPAPPGEWRKGTPAPMWTLRFEGKPGPPVEVMVLFQHQYSDGERQRIADAILAALKATHEGRSG
jgi:ATP-dependent Clp protease ATP-binding subunit ClpC